MEISLNDDISVLLDKINYLLTQYPEETDENSLKQMVYDYMLYCKQNPDTMLGIFKSLNKEYKTLTEYKKIKDENIYDYDLLNRINVLLNLLKRKYNESQKELSRVNYNLKSINQLFSLMNFALNNPNIENIQTNYQITKINIGALLINGTFEKIRDKIDEILDSDENQIESKLNILLNECNNDSQTIGEVLASRFRDIKDDPVLHSKYSTIRNFLINKGFDGKYSSLFQIIRNAISHGEYYPKIDGDELLEIAFDNNGKEKRTLSKTEFFQFLESKLATIPLNSKYDIFLRLYYFDDLKAEVSSLISESKKDELLTSLAILGIFNIVEYNNEQFFKNTYVGMSDTKKVDLLEVKKYFDTSYDSTSRNNWDIMQTIKNAIGHMNIEYQNGQITFTNAIANERCSTNLFRIFSFMIRSNICSIATATEFAQKFNEETKRLNNNLDTYIYKKNNKDLIYNDYPYEIYNNDNNIKKY